MYIHVYNSCRTICLSSAKQIFSTMWPAFKSSNLPPGTCMYIINYTCTCTYMYMFVACVYRSCTNKNLSTVCTADMQYPIQCHVDIQMYVHGCKCILMYMYMYNACAWVQVYTNVHVHVQVQNVHVHVHCMYKHVYVQMYMHVCAVGYACCLLNIHTV